MTNIEPAADVLQNLRDALEAKNTKEAKRLYKEGLIENYRVSIGLAREYSAAKKEARELLKKA